MKANIILTVIAHFVFLQISNAQVDKLQDLRTSKKIVSVSHLPTQEDWAIQIIALQLPAGNPSFFNNIDHAREFVCADNYVRYTVGNYDSYAKAKDEVEHYKELGYTQSFVVDCSKYNLGGEAKTKFDPNATYTVQLSAFRFPVYLSHFDGIDNVMEFYLKDRVYRYTVGSGSHEEVEVILDGVKAKGFKDAFITQLDPYLPYQIE